LTGRWYSLGGHTDLDLQVPLCRSHHIWIHERGTTLTREYGHLVFRDPAGRTITNTHQTLTDQLHLLHPPPPTHPGTATDTDTDTGTGTGTGSDTGTGSGEWPDSPYLHGRWGSTGQDPDPPPGHAPPEHAPPLVG
jgi:hypothetical protein